MSSSYRNSLTNWLAELDVRGHRVGDVGGSQLPVKGRTKSWDVDEYAIYDIEEPHEGKPHPDIVCDLNDEFYANAFEPSCDIVFCLETYDYVWHPANAFKIISGLLVPGGTAYISFGSIYPLHQPVKDDALRYMPGALEKLAIYAGLEIVQMIKRRPETDLFEQFYRAERMRAAKHTDHFFTGFIVEYLKPSL